MELYCLGKPIYLQYSPCSFFVVYMTILRFFLKYLDFPVSHLVIIAQNITFLCKYFGMIFSVSARFFHFNPVIVNVFVSQTVVRRCTNVGLTFARSSKQERVSIPKFPPKWILKDITISFLFLMVSLESQKAAFVVDNNKSA